MGKESCSHCLQRSPVFRSLDPSELEAINCHRVSVHFHAGEVLFKQGSPCYSYICVTSGMVKLYTEHDNNQKTILGLVTPVEYIHTPGAFTDQRHHYTAIAAEETTACIIDNTIMHQMIRENPGFAMDFITKISGESITLIERIACLSQKQVYGRMADTLIYLSKKVYKSDTYNLSISRQDLADLSGMTKESAIRVLKRFKEDGVITMDGNQVSLTNIDLLASISQKG